MLLPIIFTLGTPLQYLDVRLSTPPTAPMVSSAPTNANICQCSPSRPSKTIHHHKWECLKEGASTLAQSRAIITLKLHGIYLYDTTWFGFVFHLARLIIIALTQIVLLSLFPKMVMCTWAVAGGIFMLMAAIKHLWLPSHVYLCPTQTGFIFWINFLHGRIVPPSLLFGKNSTQTLSVWRMEQSVTRDNIPLRRHWCQLLSDYCAFLLSARFSKQCIH